MHLFDTKKLARTALLPCVAALTFAIAPAHAITIAANSAPAAASTSSASTSSQPSLTKKQLKQQRKMAKKCRKVTKKLAKAKVGTSRHATLSSMQSTYCPKSSTPAASVVDQPSKPASAPAESNAEEASASSNAGGGASPGSSPNSNASPANVSPPRNTPPVLAAVLSAPPIFLPASQDIPEQQGSTEPEAGYKSDNLEVLALPPTNVPEPGSLALLGLGLVGLGLARRRSTR